MLQSWNGAYESKEQHKMKETKEKMKLSTIRIVVISETCLLIIRHKKKVMHVNPLIYFCFIMFCFCSQNVSSGIGLLVCCICTSNLHETRNLHENVCVCVCVCVCVRVCTCVRTYVGVVVTEMGELKLTPKSGWSGRD